MNKLIHSPIPSEAIILFADLIGSSRLSDVLSISEYSSVICQFQERTFALLKKITNDLTKQNFSFDYDGSIRGEELFFLIVIPEEKNLIEKNRKLSKAANTVLKLALEMKLQWLFWEKNLERIRMGAAPHQVAIGLHSGHVVMVKQSRAILTKKGEAWSWTAETNKYNKPMGFAINFAKRVETAARYGDSSRIAVSQSFLSICRRAGLPVLIGSPLQFETKGFDFREPIYELIGQDIIKADEILSVNKSSLTNNLDIVSIIYKAFSKNPESTLWLLEIAIDKLVLDASASTDSENSFDKFTQALQLAEYAAQVTPQPARLLYRAARCLHRRNHGSDRDSALHYYEQAVSTKDPALFWAEIDLAAAYWLQSQRSEDENTARTYLHKAKDACSRLIMREPRHPYVYNLRALVSANLAQKYNADSIDRESILNDAENDLAKARNFDKKLDNERPEFLYLGTQAHIEESFGKLENALFTLKKAQDSLTNMADLTQNQINPEFFYQPGLAVLGFIPPRPKALLTAWDRLKENILKKLER